MSDYKDVTVPGAPLRGVEELQGQLDRFAESTSAALRRVEQERDEMASRLARLRRDTDAQLADARERLATATVLARKTVQAREERDLARAELASARQELDAVRTARDNLDRQLALAHREVLELDAQIKLCPRCGVQLAAEVAAEQAGGTE